MEISCKICDKGLLQQKKKYRMSGPVVLIGYILLIPSVLGVAGSLVAFSHISSAASSSGADAGVAFAGGFIILFGVGCFVAGLLGWLLIMKKQVLQCNVCGAVVNAN